MSSMIAHKSKHMLSEAIHMAQYLLLLHGTDAVNSRYNNKEIYT